MSSKNLSYLTIAEARAGLLAGEFTCLELVESYLQKIEEKNKNLNVFLEVYDDVREQAKAADEIYKNDKAKAQSMPLLGIPVTFKDNLLLKGKRAQAASKVLDGYVAPYTATAVQKLQNAGAIFMGRANMDEFAMGSSTENSAFGVTKNPHDEERVAGGSSGGSAASVAADMSIGALGSDTGGSVRQPAALCGVVGFKPTYGSISRHGLMAMGSSLDIIGTFSRNVEDTKILFDVMKGKDVLDMTSVDVEEVKAGYAKNAAPKKKIGIIKGVLDQGGIDEEVKKNTLEAIEIFKKKGYEIVELDMPLLSYGIAVYYVIMPAEVSSNLARFDGVKYGLLKEGNTLLDDYIQTRRDGFGPETRRRVLLGTYVLSSGYYDAYYGKALAVRDLMKKDFAKAFETVDAVLTPTAPTPAFKIGEKADDPVSMYLADVFTVTANLVGTPAISLPSGWTTGEKSNGKKLPLAIHLTAPHAQEEMLFTIAKEFEAEVGFKLA